MFFCVVYSLSLTLKSFHIITVMGENKQDSNSLENVASLSTLSLQAGIIIKPLL